MKRDLKDLRVGREFEAKEIIEAKAWYLREKTKAAIVFAVLVGVALALSVALYQSVVSGSYQPVRDVWQIVSITLFLVIGLYFGKKLASGKNDDESSA